MTEATEKTVCEQLKPYQFVKGQSGNPAGRPKGSISIVDSIRHIFETDPDRFQTFIDRYLADPKNRQHIVDKIDGKPEGSGTNLNVQINNYQLTEEDKEKWAIKYLTNNGYKVDKV
jgi:hypothetical protein